MPKFYFILISYDVILEYICVKKKLICHNVFKISNIFKNLFLIFMKFYYLLNIMIGLKFVSHVKSLIIYISQMGVFQGDDHKYVGN
jgi:hypothetical protein